MKLYRNYFTTQELLLWATSAGVILVAFFLFDGENYLTLLASMLGVTSLIYNAKGNPIGPGLMVIFSLLYGYISFQATYYGEMITYVGMTGPMSFFSLISWLRNTVEGDHLQVKINRLGKKEIVFMVVLATIVTYGFYFILRYFHTANLPLSTLSVTTSFLAVYLTFRRSPYYAICYAANDVVLILLWLLMIPTSTSAISVMLCFMAFLVNDLYGFVNWRRLYRSQQEKMTLEG